MKYGEVAFELCILASKALQLAKACLQASSLGPFHCTASFRAKGATTRTSDGHGKPQTCSTSETILLRPPRAQVLPCARETCETKAVADASIERH